MKYTEKDFIEDMEIEEPVLFLEPRELFDKGIIGITEDKRHIVYGYNKLTFAIAEQFQKDEQGKEEAKDKSFDDYLLEACDCVDNDTLKSLYLTDCRFNPIIMIEYEERANIIGAVDEKK